MKIVCVRTLALAAILAFGCASPSTPGGNGNGTSDSGPSSNDAGPSSDAGPSGDAGPGADAGPSGDAGPGVDAGPTIDVQCNPVTNAGCTTTGDACDTAADMSGNLVGFSCYPGPNTVADCASCDPTFANSPFCSAGSSCFPTDSTGMVGQCAHYCCTDADCGPNGVCQDMGMGSPLFAPVSNTLGVCASAAADAGTMPFACNAPATAPSAGSCVTLTP